MAGAWARKKSQEVPIQGVIVNDETMESETDKTLTINAIKRLTHGSNILCNGDFQINQREYSEYTMNINSTKYTFDMWFIYADSNSAIKVSKTANGVRIETSGGMTQFQQKFDNLSGKFTISTKINSLNGNVRVSIYDDANWNDVKTDLKVGVNNVSFEKESFNRLAFRFTGTCVLEVEYIDLFEGSNIHSHVKEDYVLALERCLQWVYVFKMQQWSSIVGVMSDKKHINITVPNLIKKRDNLTLKASGKLHTNYAESLSFEISNNERTCIGQCILYVTLKTEEDINPL